MMSSVEYDFKEFGLLNNKYEQPEKGMKCDLSKVLEAITRKPSLAE